MQTTGRGPGRISHHTVSVRPTKEVVFYGGLKGEDSNNEIFLFNPNTNAWLSVNPSVSNRLRFHHVLRDMNYSMTQHSIANLPTLSFLIESIVRGSSS